MILLPLVDDAYYSLFPLTDVVRNDERPVSGRCRAEMNAHRKMLMDDFSLSPEVVSKCAKDIQVGVIFFHIFGDNTSCFYRKEKVRVALNKIN